MGKISDGLETLLVYISAIIGCFVSFSVAYNIYAYGIDVFFEIIVFTLLIIFGLFWIVFPFVFYRNDKLCKKFSEQLKKV